VLDGESEARLAGLQLGGVPVPNVGAYDVAAVEVVEIDPHDLARVLGPLRDDHRQVA
jgi:hypothetical protein